MKKMNDWRWTYTLNHIRTSIHLRYSLDSCYHNAHWTLMMTAKLITKYKPMCMFSILYTRKKGDVMRKVVVNDDLRLVIMVLVNSKILSWTCAQLQMQCKADRSGTTMHFFLFLISNDVLFESCGRSIHQLYSFRLCTVKCLFFCRSVASVNVNQIIANFCYQFDIVKFGHEVSFPVIANILVAHCNAFDRSRQRIVYL